MQTGTHITYNPGPSQNHPRLSEFVHDALDAGIPALSHRSQQFADIVAETTANLRQLLDIPADYHVWFLASATEAMERIIENTVKRSSHHVVCGAFSQRFATIAQELGKTVGVTPASAADCHEVQNLKLPSDVELLALTHNETSNGTTLDADTLASIRQANPDVLIALDLVSSTPIIPVDLAQVDMAFFSIQKAFGLPPGLAVLIASPRALGKARQLQASGQSIGSYHSFTELAKFAAKSYTPETPNTLAIYLLGRVASDYLTQGLPQIQDQLHHQAAQLYRAIDDHPHLKAIVAEQTHRSVTVIVAEVTGGNQTVIDSLSRHGHQLGRGYAQHKTSHIRIANFPAHLGTTQDLVKHLEQWRHD